VLELEFVVDSDSVCDRVRDRGQDEVEILDPASH